MRKKVIVFFLISMFFSIPAAYAMELETYVKEQPNYITNLSLEISDQVDSRLDFKSILHLDATCTQMQKNHDERLQRCIAQSGCTLDGLIHFSCNNDAKNLQRMFELEEQLFSECGPLQKHDIKRFEDWCVRRKIIKEDCGYFFASNGELASNWFRSTFFGADSKLPLWLLKKAEKKIVEQGKLFVQLKTLVIDYDVKEKLIIEGKKEIDYLKNLSDFAKRAFKALYNTDRFTIKLSDDDIDFNGDGVITLLYHFIKPENDEFKYEGELVITTQDHDFFKFLFDLVKNKNLRDRSRRTVLHDAVLHSNVEITKFLCNRSKVTEDSQEINESIAFCDTPTVISKISKNHGKLLLPTSRNNRPSASSLFFTNKKQRPSLFGSGNTHTPFLEPMRLDTFSEPPLPLRWLQPGGYDDDHNDLVRVVGEVQESMDEISSTLSTQAAAMMKKEQFLKERTRSWLSTLDLDPNIEDKNGHTAFEIAVWNRNVEITKLLLAIPGINVNNKDSGRLGGSVFHWAVRNSNIELVKLFLDCKKFKINDQDNVGKTVLHYAAERANIYIDMMHLLLSVPGIQIDAKDNDQETALHKASTFGRVKLLMEYGADVHSRNNNGDTPFHSAVLCRDLDIIKLFLEHPKIDVNIQNDFGNTALHCAAERVNSEITRLLLDAGIKVNTQNNNKETALYKAVRKDNCEHVRLLLERGADVNSRHEYDRTALYLAIMCDKPEITQLLLNVLGIDVNMQDNDQKDTALLRAIRDRNLENVKLLLGHPDIDLEIINQLGNTALTLAILLGGGGGSEIVEALLTCKNLKINWQDKFGNSILHWVVTYSYNPARRLFLYSGITERLLKVPGIDVNSLNECGERPLSLAIKINNSEIIKMLMDRPDIQVTMQDRWNMFKDSCNRLLKNQYFINSVYCATVAAFAVVFKKIYDNKKHLLRAWAAV